MKIENFFSESGLLKRHLELFEYRDSQLAMAQLIEIAIKKEEHVIIEAGTGTGKSFAYLIPLIFYSTQNNKPVVISTNTKSLQQQMIKKDLPFLKNIFNQNDSDFSFKIFYGSNNYLCLHKAKDLLTIQSSIFLTDEVREYLIQYINSPGQSGIYYDIGINISNDIWYNINRDADMCLRKDCKFFKDCFYYKNLKELYSTNIIVVNHHVFFANIGSEYKILPPFKVFVWDEAHNIEDVAAKFLAEVVSEKEMNFIFNQLSALPSRVGRKNDFIKDQLTFFQKINNTHQLFTDFFDFFRKNFQNNTRIKGEKLPEDILTAFNEFVDYISKIFKVIEGISDEIDREIDLLYRKLIKIRDNLKFFLDHDNEEYVFWVEIIGRKKLVDLKFTPINISLYLKNKVFQVYKTGILTSATLSTNNNFNFIKSRLGLTNCAERIFQSPFDYKRQVQLYINEDISLPLNYDRYLLDLKKDIIKLLNYNNGKAFILFTSYRTLNSIKEMINQEVDQRLLFQNEMSFNKLIKEFKQDINSILLGTLSFWEGVDVPGEALSLVIITRLPFDVPDDPLISARIEYIKRKNGNPFMEYQLPNAIILLKQGFGRLIRNSNDKGIVAILDSRIVKKSYGKLFLNSLPECDVMREF